MPISVEELQKIKQHAGYAQYIHTNLHMHTPATPWDWNPYQHQSQLAHTVSHNDYFNALNQTSLELVAITDHNCVEWCQPLIDIAAEHRRKGLSRLHILPGVEITTYEGPHILAIFDAAQSVAEMRKMLVRLGMSGEGRQDDKVSCRSPGSPKPIKDVIDEISGLGGLVIAPHVHTKDGLWGSKEFRGREDVLNDERLRILAAPSGDIKRVKEGNGRVRYLYKSMDNTRIRNSFAFINISDCHRLDDFELNTTWIKMCNPSLEGVRQIIFEPELRICHRLHDTKTLVSFPEVFQFQTPLEVNYPHVVGLAISGGMLDNQCLAFSPHQNCIIGKNYAGKSALVDCIRFVLDVIPVDEEASQRFINRLRGIIGMGGQVRIYVCDAQKKIFGIQRTLTCTQVGRKEIWKLEGKPEVYSLWNNEFHRESDLIINPILPLEVYPQGEVVKIKDNANRQMTIVDSLAQLGKVIANLTEDEFEGNITLHGELAENSRAIVELETKRETLRSNIEGISDLEHEIIQLEELANSPLLTDMKLWSDVKLEINDSIQKLQKFDSEIQKVGVGSPVGNAIANLEQVAQEASSTTLDFDAHTASLVDFSNEIKRVYLQASGAASDHVVFAIRQLNAGLSELKDLQNACGLRYEKIKQQVEQQLTAGQGDIVQTVLVGRIEQKRSRLVSLRSKETELSTLDEKLRTLQLQRQEWLQHYHASWQDIRQKRIDVVKLINQDSADNIHAELEQSCHKDKFVQVLGSIADSLGNSTNRITNRQRQVETIVEHISPFQLVDIIIGGDVNKLQNECPGLTANTARLFMSMTRADIHQLETCVIHDKFVISLQKEGDSTFTPIEGGLSGGEQALALISVAMVRKSLPLIIDQPEDELGQALITKDLVESIRRVKPYRQMIFVTHVPNIPVLSDSEQVIYIEQNVESSGKKSVVRHRGSLENPDIVNRLLELDGGKWAIQKRYERYAPLLKA